MHRYYYRNKAISEKDCDEFIDKHKDAEFTKGLLNPNDPKNNEKVAYRNSKVHWLENNDLLVRTLWSHILEMNQNFWQLNIDGYQTAQLTKYDDGCYYEWHKDAFYEYGRTRKLTAVLQLSKPEDYKGCELQLFYGADESEEEIQIKGQGSIIMFKSDEWHRVTKLTEGTRYSLVLWAMGPQLI
jgi:PKHD-type hydroxylase|tara:strand:+ start:1056 stop:1607 length:552 start_codon:yes stop_codon:yes gene_type:complete